MVGTKSLVLAAYVCGSLCLLIADVAEAKDESAQTFTETRIAPDATGGWVSTYIFAKGGCRSHRDLFQGLILNGGTSQVLLGRAADEWTEADAAEALRVYRDCDAKFIAQGQNDSRQQSMARAYAASAAQQIARLEGALANFVRAGTAQAAERRTVEVARSAKLRADAQRKLDEADEKARLERERLSDQSKLDKEAADEAARRAAAEEPKIAEATRQAEEARVARQAAEQRLAEVRSRIGAEDTKRMAEIAKMQAAEAARQEGQRKEAEREEDVRLSQKCQVSLEQFNQARFGMRLREVERLFGCKGNQVSGTRVPGYGVVSTYSWEGNTFTSNVTATFRNSSLESKAQLGLD
jgi:hypothetical protein